MYKSICIIIKCMSIMVNIHTEVEKKTSDNFEASCSIQCYHVNVMYKYFCFKVHWLKEIIIVTHTREEIKLISTMRMAIWITDIINRGQLMEACEYLFKCKISETSSPGNMIVVRFKGLISLHGANSPHCTTFHHNPTE